MKSARAQKKAPAGEAGAGEEEFDGRGGITRAQTSTSPNAQILGIAFRQPCRYAKQLTRQMLILG